VDLPAAFFPVNLEREHATRLQPQRWQEPPLTFPTHIASSARHSVHLSSPLYKKKTSAERRMQKQTHKNGLQLACRFLSLHFHLHPAVRANP
jgi:hypothetical protein